MVLITLSFHMQPCNMAKKYNIWCEPLSTSFKAQSRRSYLTGTFIWRYRRYKQKSPKYETAKKNSLNSVSQYAINGHTSVCIDKPTFEQSPESFFINY